MGPDTPGPWLVFTTLEAVDWDAASQRRFAVVKTFEILPLKEDEALVYVGPLSKESMYGRGYHVVEIVRPMFSVGSANLAGVGDQQ